MQALIAHMILHHGAKRIAFLRGPGNHQGAQFRYRAYVDTLGQYGVPFDGRLVSDPVAWQDGEKALRQLLDDRHLVPGKDFDTLVCSSDMMMFSAGKVLEMMGIGIPRDLRLGGFNDSEESLLLESPCTTVHMPVDEMASLSYHQLLDLLDNPAIATKIPCFPLRWSSAGPVDVRTLWVEGIRRGTVRRKTRCVCIMAGT